MDAYIISRAIGTVRIDTTLRESHESNLQVTENPVESGAIVADHAALEPPQLTITGRMVDWLAMGVNFEAAEMISTRNSVDFLNDIQLPAAVNSYTSGTIYQARRVAGMMSGDYRGTFQALGLSRALAPWIPDFAPASSLDLSAGSLRVRQCYENLRTVQRSGDPVEIVTGSQRYGDMLLLSVGMDQYRDGSADLSITAKGIFIVETQTVSGITVQGGGDGSTSPAGASKSGRAETQSMSVKNKGNIQTPAADEGGKISAGKWLYKAWKGTAA